MTGLNPDWVPANFDSCLRSPSLHDATNRQRRLCLGEACTNKKNPAPLGGLAANC